MKRTFVTAFALLSMMSLGAKADEKPLQDTTAVKHLNLNEIKVSASRVDAKMKDLPQKIEVITARSISATPANDLAELLKKSSGLDIVQYPGIKSAIGMRGFSPSTSNKYNVILVNGLPVGTENIATLNLDNVERVEILKGPFSALYGSDAMAGVINIVTKRSDEALAGQVALSYGSFQTARLNANVGGKVTDKLSFDVALSRHQQNADYSIGRYNFLNMSTREKAIIGRDTYGEKMENTEFSKNNANVRLGYQISDNWSVDVNGEYFLAKGVETPGSFWHVYGMKKKDVERYGLALDIKGTVGIHQLSIAPYYNNEDADYYNRNAENKFFTSNRNTLKVYGFQVQDKISIREHALVVGVDNKTSKYENLYWKADGAVKAPNNPDNFDRNLGALAQLHLKLMNNKMNVVIGARYDNIKFQIENNALLNSKKSDETYSVVNPNVGVKYEVTKNLSGHASFGTAFLAPTAYQMAGSYSGYYNYVGNSDLNPEKSKTFDLGVAYNNFVKGIKMDVTYFDTRHKDMIVSVYTDKVNKIKTFENANKAKMRGLEIAGSYDFGALYDYNYSLRVYANYTHMLKTKVEMKEGDTTVDYDLRNVRRNSGNFGVEFDNLKGFTTRLNARYSGSRYEDNWYTYYPDYRSSVTDKVLKHPDFMIFDLSASYAINKKVTLGMTMANLLDENYTEKDGYNMPGRSIMGKVIVRF